MSERRPRPIFSIRQGEHDRPPASGHRLSTTSTRRRPRPQRRFDTEFDDSVHFTGRLQDADTVTADRPRRRQRSMSPESSSPHDAAHSVERRLGYDDIRQRLTKRRRIDLDVLPTPCPPIKYGYYGQVEPGRLKMFMISCDGGQHADHRCPNIDLGPHNVLRTDKSVYCSERKKASIVLRHADDTPFSLTQISIVAPEHGFTAPVREGAVYVGMTMDALSKYTDKVEHAGQQDRPPPYSAEPGWLRDSGHGTSSPDQLSLPMPSNTRLSTHQHEQQVTQQYSGQSNLNAYTTVTSDTDLGLEDVSSQEVLDFRLQRMQLLQRRDWRERRLHRSLPLQADFSPFADQQPQNANVDADRQALYEPVDLFSPSTTDSNEGRECQVVPERSKLEHARLLQEGKLPREDPAITFTWFHIEEQEHKVTIKFRTPVSGRFILLNLTSRAHADNVDVQSVMASGYAGPRFFPAIQPR